MTGDSRKKARLKDSRIAKKVKCITKYCWDLVKYMNFVFFGRKLKDIKIMVSSETWMYARVTFNIGPYQYVQNLN